MHEVLFIGGPHDGSRRKIELEVLQKSRKREVYVDVVNVIGRMKNSSPASYRIKCLSHGGDMMPVCISDQITKAEAIAMIFNGYGTNKPAAEKAGA